MLPFLPTALRISPPVHCWSLFAIPPGGAVPGCDDLVFSIGLNEWNRCLLTKRISSANRGAQISGFQEFATQLLIWHSQTKNYKNGYVAHLIDWTIILWCRSQQRTTRIQSLAIGRRVKVHVRSSRWKYNDGEFVAWRAEENMEKNSSERGKKKNDVWKGNRREAGRCQEEGK